MIFRMVYKSGPIFLPFCYRAACNADAVLWWEFCLSVCPSVRPSVRLSHACIV